MSAVATEVAKALVEKYLRALKDYRNEARDGLAMALQDTALGVGHAEATLKQFDHECPTPREIKDTALNLREKFLPPAPAQKDKWEAEGYTYDANVFRQITQEITANLAGGKFWPNQNELMWRAIKKHLKLANFRDVSWGECWNAAAELGFPLNLEQREARDRWLATKPGGLAVLTQPVPVDFKQLAAADL